MDFYYKDVIRDADQYTKYVNLACEMCDKENYKRGDDFLWLKNKFTEVHWN